MSPLQRPFGYVVFTALLLGASACSDKGSAEKNGQGSGRAAQPIEKPDQPSDAARQRLASRVKDVAISAKVKARILGEKGLETSDIYVTAHDRVVVLTGTVEKPEDATRAIRIAQSVNDVESVENQLAVRSGG